jgi:hypothetical protein
LGPFLFDHILRRFRFDFEAKDAQKCLFVCLSFGGRTFWGFLAKRRIKSFSLLSGNANFWLRQKYIRECPF